MSTPTPKYQRGYLPDLTGFFAALVVLGVIVGAVLAVGLPWLWSVIKPFIHALTA